MRPITITGKHGGTCIVGGTTAQRARAGIVNSKHGGSWRRVQSDVKGAVGVPPRQMVILEGAIQILIVPDEKVPALSGVSLGESLKCDNLLVNIIALVVTSFEQKDRLPIFGKVPSNRPASWA